MQLEAAEVDGKMQAGETNEKLEYMQCSMREIHRCLEVEEEDLDPKQESGVGENTYETYVQLGWGSVWRYDRSMRWFRLA